MKDNEILRNTENENHISVEEKDRISLDEVGPFLFSNATCAVLVFSAVENGKDFCIELLNSNCEELFGMDLDGIRGKTLKEILPGIVDTDYPDVLKRVWLTGKSEFISGRIYDVSGNRVWREFSVYRLPSGKLLAFCKDVEKEKLYEIQRDLLIKRTLEGVFIADKEGNYIDVNDKACMITGYTREELLKMNLLDLFREEDKNTAKAHFRNLRENGEEIARIPFVHKNGDLRNWHVSAFAIEPLERYIAFVQDITALMKSRKKLVEANIKLKDAFYNTLRTISHVVEAKDMYSRGHHERVAEMALKICREMGLEDKLGDKVYKAALVHDAGKIKIPTEILNSSRILSENEHHLIKLHTLYSRDILSGIGLDEDVLEIIEQHHERMDGKGYPRNLQGNQIRMGAKILIIANTFDSLCLNKPHRKGLSSDKALAEIRETGIAAFDPDVLDAFFNIVEFAEIKT